MAHPPLTQEQFDHRLAELFAKEAHQPLVLWYLSFADEEGWLGACIVEARGLASALQRCNLLHINPHGEVRAVPVPAGVDTPLEYRDRLLSKEDLERCYKEPIMRWPESEG
jgi:hypothetical protein